MKKLSAMLVLCMSMLTLTAHAEANHVRTIKLNNGYLNLTIINKTPVGMVGFVASYNMSGMLEPGQRHEDMVDMSGHQAMAFYGWNVEGNCDVDFEPKDKNTVVATFSSTDPYANCDIDENGVITVEFNGGII